MFQSEFDVSKVKRKIKKNGPRETALAAVDLYTRKRLGTPLFDLLSDRNAVRTVSRADLLQRGSTIITTSDKETCFITQVNDGYILSQTGLSFTREIEIIEETAAEPKHASEAMMEMCFRELFYGGLPVGEFVSIVLGASAPKSVKEIDQASPLIPRYPNYYHWMVETVPRIRYLREYESATNSQVTALIPSDAPPFVEETMELLGWPASKIKHATAPVYEVQNLVVPSYPDRTANDFEWIRKDILSAASEHQQSSSESGSNVYVSRSNAIERRVLNEEEVMAVLSEYGFSKYHLEDRSVQANARLFNEADVVVGPHGAGLTDIIFAKDCTLVELFGEKVKQPYRALAGTLDIEYEPMYCTAKSADIVIDTDELESRVSRLTS